MCFLCVKVVSHVAEQVLYIYIYIYIYIKPFRALWHYSLVTGTNKQSYSNLNLLICTKPTSSPISVSLFLRQ